MSVGVVNEKLSLDKLSLSPKGTEQWRDASR